MNTDILNKAYAATLGTDCTMDISTLVNQFCSYGLSHLSKGTMPARISRIKLFRDFCYKSGVTDARNINITFLDIYFEYRAESVKTTSVTADKRVIRSFLEWVYGYKEIPISLSVQKIKIPRERKETVVYLHWETVAEAIYRCKNKQDALMIALAFEAGLRISELVAVKMCDFYRTRLHIKGKGSRERTVMITQNLKDALTNFANKNNRTGDTYLFQNVYNGSYQKTLTINTARNRIQRAFLRIGVKMTPHHLRHGFAVYLLGHGCDLVSIQKLLGHQYLETTRCYLRIDDKIVQKSYDSAMTSVLPLLT